MSNLVRNHPPRRQQGVSTLLIAMLMLAILTIITLFAARYGVNEQRTSANEYRYKMAFHVAEAGLQQSMEYIKLNTSTMMSTATGGWLDPGAMQWEPCTEATTMDPDPCLAEPNDTWRAGMYRYIGAASGVLPVSAVMPPLDGTNNKVGDFTAGYKSYATLCRLDMSTPTAPLCALAPTTGDSFYVTVVSRGALSDENATATIKQSFGTFHLLGATPAAPLIAAGTVNGLGNAQIIPNPDAGGPGIPVSVWSEKNVDIDDSGGGTGSFATCQLGEWLGSEPPATTQDSQDRLNGVCTTCDCNKLDFGYGMLSGHKGGSKYEGEDILDVDGNLSEASPKVRDSKYFPNDLFAYIFGVASGTDEQNFLELYATKITSCSAPALTPGSGGLYWYTGSDKCDLGSAGTLQRPVVLVSDGPVVFSANSEFFGIIFVREEAGAGDLFTAHGGGQIYGAVILEGEAKLTGNPTIVYNKAVLANIRNSPDFVRYGPIPGSWSDSL